ncbi:hypothetical protein [Sphingomonas adhaesiva]|uniref:hypothetical protein n=1 Tax=Sphingomonas adhaesiva TaxID=28212 RepID=UPI002FF50AE4
MSHTLDASAATARQARQLAKGFTARLTGRTERGTDRKVRRHSIDVDDHRAQVFRRIGDGSIADAKGWIDCLMKTVSEWDDQERKKGGARPLGLHGLRVLEALLGLRGVIAIDFRTGRLEPAIDTIKRAAGVSRTTVIRALATLRAMKVIDWVRRTQKTDRDGLFGPQREQISNAYFLTPELLPKRVAQRLRDLVTRKRLRRTGTTPPAAPPPPPQPQDPELRTTLARLGAGIEARAKGESASPPSGQYPRAGVQG